MRKTIMTLIAAVLLTASGCVLGYSLAVPSSEAYSHYLAPDHQHSPVGYGLGVYGTLREDSGGHTDQTLCVAKTDHGEFDAVSQGHNNETDHTYRVEVSNFGNTDCKDTDHNLEKHRAGSNNWNTFTGTNWGATSWHDANSSGGGGGGGGW